jgi:hypothetical protein
MESRRAARSTLALQKKNHETLWETYLERLAASRIAAKGIGISESRVQKEIRQMKIREKRRKMSAKHSKDPLTFQPWPGLTSQIAARTHPTL